MTAPKVAAPEPVAPEKTTTAKVVKEEALSTRCVGRVSLSVPTQAKTSFQKQEIGGVKIEWELNSKGASLEEIVATLAESHPKMTESKKIPEGGWILEFPERLANADATGFSGVKVSKNFTYYFTSTAPTKLRGPFYKIMVDLIQHTEWQLGRAPKAGPFACIQKGVVDIGYLQNENIIEAFDLGQEGRLEVVSVVEETKRSAPEKRQGTLTETSVGGAPLFGDTGTPAKKVTFPELKAPGQMTMTSNSEKTHSTYLYEYERKIDERLSQKVRIRYSFPAAQSKARLITLRKIIGSIQIMN